VARRRETIASHSGGAHQYLVARTILEADVLVSVPKLKTHSKVGMTLNCKGMVGINGDKNHLPHFRWGGPAEGGDQFPEGSERSIDRQRMRLGRLVADGLLPRESAWAHAALFLVQSVTGFAARLLRFRPVDLINGDWPGNDTCWRLAADLVRVAVFADRDGRLGAVPQRRFLSVVDGIIGGEGDGPRRPTPRQCGVLIAGLHPVAVDLAGARLMGFDYREIRYLHELTEGFVASLQPGFGALLPSEVCVYSDYRPWDELLLRPADDLLNFAPPRRWVGQIELAASTRAVS
jgi:hypothetical protein